ncbi:MAG TPA: hypothetical protein VEK34_15060, partial [Methylocella sp.]|nr:hypothetical protein [Methylocella sp.]
MWHLRRQRVEQAPDEAYLGRKEVYGPAVLPLAPPSVDDAQDRGYLTPDLVIGSGAPSKVCSAYNRLRTQVLIRLQKNGWNTVAITSPSRASGNTLAAINLAISIARDFSYTVVLVELDLVNPSFRQVLGFKQRQGIADYLLRDVPIEE